MVLLGFHLSRNRRYESTQQHPFSACLVFKQDVWYKLWVCDTFCEKPLLYQQAYRTVSKIKAADSGCGADKVAVCGEFPRQGKTPYSAAVIRRSFFR
jgi:hypothetical protein